MRCFLYGNLIMLQLIRFANIIKAIESRDFYCIVKSKVTGNGRKDDRKT